MKLGFQRPRKPKCPRCRSGNVSETDERVLQREDLAKWKEVTDKDMARWECRTCDYRWADLLTGYA